jgi:hypothetical protein
MVSDMLTIFRRCAAFGQRFFYQSLTSTATRKEKLIKEVPAEEELTTVGLARTNSKKMLFVYILS